jgi:hypothetical protein
MSDIESTPLEEGAPEVLRPDDVQGEQVEPVGEPPSGEAVTQPAKVMRIGSMASRERLAEVYERSVIEVSEALSPDLQEELRSLALPFEHDEVPSEAELRVAKAQLVGWLEGLFHGIQASMMAQQAMAQAQMAQQQRSLAGGPVIPGQQAERPGTYL